MTERDTHDGEIKEELLSVDAYNFGVMINGTPTPDRRVHPISNSNFQISKDL